MDTYAFRPACALRDPPSDDCNLHICERLTLLRHVRLGAGMSWSDQFNQQTLVRAAGHDDRFVPFAFLEKVRSGRQRKFPLLLRRVVAADATRLKDGRNLPLEID